jgi:putative oxygen-independent coproporphyrinogen III oxidase
LASEDWRKGGFGLYIHWPFCESLCPYCDFNSYVSDAIDQQRWMRAYLSELRRCAAETPGRTLNSIFFGGGTPSLMDPTLIHEILAEVRRLWPVSNDLEVTMEANPSSVEAERFRDYAAAGTTRISMGIQSLDDKHLKALGRRHSVSEAISAFATARSIFDRVSFDLIYARQDQTLREWESELKTALNMAIDHISLYQLTVEEGTAFGARHAAGGLRGLPNEDLSADMYYLTQDICAGAGMPAYEISNHARDLAESRHNLIYWRYGDYLGIGPGAHGRLTTTQGKLATETVLAPLPWLLAVEKSGSGETVRTLVSGEDQAAEYLMMSLRLTEGSDLDRFIDLGGKSPSQSGLAKLMDGGFITLSGSRLSATPSGRPILNALLRELLID